MHLTLYVNRKQNILVNKLKRSHILKKISLKTHKHPITYIAVSLAGLPLSLVQWPQQALELTRSPELTRAVGACVGTVARAVVLVAQWTAVGDAEQIAKLLRALAAPAIRKSVKVLVPLSVMVDYLSGYQKYCTLNQLTK